MRINLRPVTQLQMLLVLAIVLGGGGVVYGFRQMLIQLFALALLGINTSQVGEFVRNAPRGLVMLVAATMAFPLLQVVPLPSGIWQSLPGRDLVIESFAVVGVPIDSWFSYSVDPLRTFTAFCATLAPATMIVLGWSLSAADRSLMGKTLAAVAILVLLLGAIQLSSANSIALFQQIEPDPGVLYGTFSNRNSTGIFFVIAAIVVAAFPLSSRALWAYAPALLICLFIVGVILTRSRSSMTLVLVLLAFVTIRLASTYLWRSSSSAGKAPRGVLLGSAVAIVALLAMVTASVVGGGRAAQSFERFSEIDGDRLEMWDDGAFVAGRYWPAGAGTGTFDEVFQIDESLEYVSPAKAGRAHNDYLELTIETGAIGLLLLLAWFFWLGKAVWRRRHDRDKWLAFAAHTALVCVALQSVLDYPLRNQALLCIAGLLVVFLLPDRESTR